MTIHVLPLEANIWAVKPEGRIHVPTARSLEDALNGLFEEGHTRVVVDFTEASYITSLGLKTLLVAQRRARALGGDLHLAALGPRMKEIFEMAGFEQLFTVHPSTTEAVESLKQK